MKSHRLEWIIVLLAAIAAGCSNAGTGFGTTLSGASRTAFVWKSTDEVSGTLIATVAGGKTYSGRYFQITKDTTVENIGPLWAGWGGRGGPSGGWDYWNVDASPEFITHYTARVVANLVEPGGSHMRCQLELRRPLDGMIDGAFGECQLPDGTTIDVNFPAA
jgi:hypothetical protein